MTEPIHCADFEGLALLYAAGEMETPARAAIEAHVRLCPACDAVLRREMHLAGLLAPAEKSAAEPDPVDVLLAACRDNLGKALDAEAARARGWREWLRPGTWAAAFALDFHPGWSVAALLLIAAVSGWAGFEGVGRLPLQQWSPAVMTVFAAPPPPVDPVSADAPAQAPAGNQADIAEGPQELRRRDSERNLFTANAPLSFGPGASQNPAQQQETGIPHRDETIPHFRSNVPPVRIPGGFHPNARHDLSPDGRLAELSRRMERLWWGGVRVDPTEQQTRLLQSTAPEYPEIARRAGIEGQVTLLLRIGADGSVQDVSLLSGEPILGRAAADAVEQWRYAPVRMDGQSVNVFTSVTFAFELQ